MKKFNAKTLQEAITQASIELHCSVVELEYEVIQYPSKGILGLWRKDAIIIAREKDGEKRVVEKIEVAQRDMSQDCMQIEKEIKELLSFMPYEIDTIEVSAFDKQTLFIFLDGKDAALLIGEKGYRYRALSYLLFNWIQPKYGYGIRLEIAQFLKIQEEMIEQYIQSIQLQIDSNTEFRTKNLSGVLGIIALARLRELYPNRYVCLKKEADEQYIVISQFR